MRSILILGGSGFVGGHLALRLREKHKVFVGFHKHFTKIPGTTPIPIKLNDREWVKRIMTATLPDTVIYAVGRNDPAWCDANAKEAEYAHLAGLGNLTGQTDRIQARLIYLSNGWVFDGNKGNYSEDDITVAENVLGKAKISGENYVKSRSLNHVIVRSAPLLGRGFGHNPSILDELRIGLAQGKTLKRSSRELHNYTGIESFGEFVEALLHSPIRNRILHFGGLSKISPYELSVMLAKRWGFDPSKIQEVTESSGKSSNRMDPLKDYSINSTVGSKLLKVKPLLIEQSLDLFDERLVRLYRSQAIA